MKIGERTNGENHKRQREGRHGASGKWGKSSVASLSQSSVKLGKEGTRKREGDAGIRLLRERAFKSGQKGKECSVNGNKWMTSDGAERPNICDE